MKIKNMNFILWIIVGGLLGNIFGNVLVGLLGALVGGFLATKYVQETPAWKWDVKKFSPGGLFLAVVSSLVLLVVFKLVF